MMATTGKQQQTVMFLRHGVERSFVHRTAGHGFCIQRSFSKKITYIWLNEVPFPSPEVLKCVTAVAIELGAPTVPFPSSPIVLPFRVPEVSMARLDALLTLAFGIFALAGLGFAVWCFRKSMKVSSERDGDLKMFFWAAGGMVGLVISGMSAAYILLPIFFHYVGGH